MLILLKPLLAVATVNDIVMNTFFTNSFLFLTMLHVPV